MFSDEVHFSFDSVNTEYVVHNEKERYCNDCMQFKRKREVNCFHISAMIDFDYKGSFIFYNTSEITAKEKVKSLTKKSKKKNDKEATQEAVETAGRKGKLSDNMSSEKAKKKEEDNMMQQTYLEQILKPHFVPEIKRLMTERKEDILLKEDNDEVHDT